MEIGSRVENGVVSKHKGTIKIDSLNTHTILCGNSGTGKTWLLRNMTNELNKKRPKTGILILNLAKTDQQEEYRDQIDFDIQYGDILCEILAFPALFAPTDQILRVPQQNASQMFYQQIAKMITIWIGMAEPVDSILTNVFKYAQEHSQQITTLQEFFKGFYEYSAHNPYHGDYQQDLTQAVENRHYALLDPLLNRVTQSPPGYIPKWFRWWLEEGKVIMMDLSGCKDEKVQHLLVLCIFNMIRILTMGQESRDNRLRALVMIDESHRILKKAPKREYQNAHDLMEEFVEQFLEEFRSRGLGFVHADQSPSQLFDSAYRLPNLKILFSVDQGDIPFLNFDKYTSDVLLHQELFHAVVMNKNSGEFYFLKTAEDPIVKRSQDLPINDPEWWLYQKCISDGNYRHPKILNPEFRTFLIDQIPAEMERKTYRNAVFITHALILNEMADLWSKANIFLELPDRIKNIFDFLPFFKSYGLFDLQFITDSAVGGADPPIQLELWQFQELLDHIWANKTKLITFDLNYAVRLVLQGLQQIVENVHKCLDTMIQRNTILNVEETE
jgi:hypothetical protein